ncbi:MAG: septum formation initiator [Bacilli bacterium]|nr:septum formation initiator [Bacilli bacterium]
MERFNSSFKGYNIDEVNKFVDDMTREYGAIIDKLRKKDLEIDRLKRENSDLQRKVDSNSIGSIYNASEEISRMAKYEAKTIIEDAKKNASRIVNEALLEAEKIEIKAENLRRNMVVFKRRMRTVVKSQLETIDDIEEIKLDE